MVTQHRLPSASRVSALAVRSWGWPLPFLGCCSSDMRHCSQRNQRKGASVESLRARRLEGLRAWRLTACFTPREFHKMPLRGHRPMDKANLPSGEPRNEAMADGRGPIHHSSRRTRTRPILGLGLGWTPPARNTTYALLLFLLFFLLSLARWLTGAFLAHYQARLRAPPAHTT